MPRNRKNPVEPVAVHEAPAEERKPETELVGPPMRCQECRRPIWQDTEFGEPYYRHIDGRFDMVNFRLFHLAELYIPPLPEPERYHALTNWKE